MRIGVMAVQGSFSLHGRVLHSIGVEPVEVRHSGDLKDISGIILPGGESTTFRIVLDGSDMGDRLLRELRGGLPAWGTCAGAILLGKGDDRPGSGWGLIDLEVVRNAYGRQVDSFVAPLSIQGFEELFDGVFIRAPRFKDVGRGVEVLAEYEYDPVMARQDNLLVTSFHPELTPDARVHLFFTHALCAGLDWESIKSA